MTDWSTCLAVMSEPVPPVSVTNEKLPIITEESHVRRTSGQKIRHNREKKDPQIMARMRAQAVVMQAHRAAKQKKKDLVREKVRLGMPISEEERNLLTWGSKKVGSNTDNDIIAAASKLLMQPTHIKELRILVERTAAKYAYNPIEELIRLTQPVKGETKHQIPADERISIHKALLPFLVPVLSVPKTAPEVPESGGTRVVITQYTFPAVESSTPIHEQPVTTVVTET